MQLTTMKARGLVLLAALLALSLAACSKGAAVKLPRLPGKPPAFDKAALESAIDGSFGGGGTCVIVADTASGAEVYRYNSNTVCTTLLPPCATYAIANDLIGLDAGAITPTTVLKWDRSPQPLKSWERDADMSTAFKETIAWWDARVAATVGLPRVRDRLKAFGYGNEAPDGRPASFWQGPAQGGELGISTRDHVQFLHRLYAGRLPVAPASAQAVEDVMVDEIRGPATISGKTGSCATLADGSRSASWWVGRLKTATNDWVFAASLTDKTENAPPGIEVEARIKDAFAKAGIWPGL